MASVEENHNAKKTEMMTKAFECFSENGVQGTGIRALGKYCGFNHSMIYTYFKNLDELIIQSIEHGMIKVEEDVLTKAPKSVEDIERFIDEIPYWTAKKHGKKYRLMYQVYTQPKYREYGKKFFDGINQRYTEYAERSAENLGISVDILRPMIFVFIRACVHYALYEDEFYLNEQLKYLKMSIPLFIEKYGTKKTEIR